MSTYSPSESLPTMATYGLSLLRTVASVLFLHPPGTTLPPDGRSSWLLHSLCMHAEYIETEDVSNAACWWDTHWYLPHLCILHPVREPRRQTCVPAPRARWRDDGLVRVCSIASRLRSLFSAWVFPAQRVTASHWPCDTGHSHGWLWSQLLDPTAWRTLLDSVPTYYWQSLHYMWSNDVCRKQEAGSLQLHQREVLLVEIVI